MPGFSFICIIALSQFRIIKPQQSWGLIIAISFAGSTYKNQSQLLRN